MWHLFENETLMWWHFSIIYHSMKINYPQNNEKQNHSCNFLGIKGIAAA